MDTLGILPMQSVNVLQMYGHEYARKDPQVSRNVLTNYVHHNWIKIQFSVQSKYTTCYSITIPTLNEEHFSCSYDVYGWRWRWWWNIMMTWWSWHHHTRHLSLITISLRDAFRTKLSLLFKILLCVLFLLVCINKIFYELTSHLGETNLLNNYQILSFRDGEYSNHILLGYGIT
jgi:hypothetical protein